jgi:mRNA interferase MazF
MTRFGIMFKQGTVVLAQLQFTDTFEIKCRPAVVLYEQHGNIVVAGVTSNIDMEGIPLTRKEGAAKNSVIKPNYIFTISERMIKRQLFTLSPQKHELLITAIIKLLGKPSPDDNPPTGHYRHKFK